MKAPLSRHSKVTWPPPASGDAYAGSKLAPPMLPDSAILRDVTIFRTHGFGGLPDHLKLQTEFEGRIQVADLWVDDPTVLEPLRVFLWQRRGRSLSELGNLEIEL